MEWGSAATMLKEEVYVKNVERDLGLRGGAVCKERKRWAGFLMKWGKGRNWNYFMNCWRLRLCLAIIFLISDKFFCKIVLLEGRQSFFFESEPSKFYMGAIISSIQN